MLACWACEFRFDSKHVFRDGLLKARSAKDGGPFRLYNCPRCFKPSKVETTAKERHFASPPRDFSVMDYLFGWFELLSPNDFLRVVRWHQRYGDHRRQFFEHDGDRRYSRPTVRGTLRQWFAGKDGGDAEVEAWRRRREMERRQERLRRAKAEPPPRSAREESPPEPELAEEIPHPYRILGVALDASSEDIRRAFQRLVRTHHPDKQASRDPAVLEEANRRLQELLAAYEELLRNRGE